MRSSCGDYRSDSAAIGSADGPARSAPRPRLRAIRTGSQSGVLGVPASAVLRDDKNEPIVYVQVEPGKFAQRSVTIGALQDGMVAITRGLQKGESVLADGSLFVQ